MNKFLIALLLCIAAIAACHAAVVLQENITPSNFASFFDFDTFSGCDNETNRWADPVSRPPTNNYMGDSEMTSPTPSSGQTDKVLRAAWDYATNKPVAPRLTAKSATFVKNNLYIVDVNHIPAGNFVWPALWFLPDVPCSPGRTWPANGEIDFIEGWQVTESAPAMPNKFVLHTAKNLPTHCNVPYVGPNSQWSNSYTYHPCNGGSSTCPSQITCDAGVGCAHINDPSTDFNSINGQGGAIFALVWNDSGFYQWAWPKYSAPSDVRVSGGSIPTPVPFSSAWGTPKASVPFSNCNSDTFFGPRAHRLNIDIKICGQKMPGCINGAPPTSETAYYDQYWSFSSIRRYSL